MLGINIISPLPGQVFRTGYSDLQNGIPVIIHITFGCGAPACASCGMGKSEALKIRGILERPDRSNVAINLKFTGNVSEFQGIMDINITGRYSIFIEASDPETGSSGRLVSDFTIR